MGTKLFVELGLVRVVHNWERFEVLIYEIPWVLWNEVGESAHSLI